jgi:hypothetical protein
MAARLIDAAFALIYLRLLGRTDVGAYTFLVVLTTYFDTLVDFGLNALLAREIPRDPAIARAALRRVSVLRLGLWLLGLPIALAVYGPDVTWRLMTDAALPGLSSPGPAADGPKSASGVLWGLNARPHVGGLDPGHHLEDRPSTPSCSLAGLGLIGLAGTSLVVNVVTAVARFVAPARETHAAPRPLARAIVAALPESTPARPVLQSRCPSLPSLAGLSAGRVAPLTASARAGTSRRVSPGAIPRQPAPPT